MELLKEKSTITVRIIRSFEYKNHRNLVFHDLDLAKVTLRVLSEQIKERLQNTPALRPIANHNYDTFKLYSQPHGAKSNNPIINVGGDDMLIMKDYDRPLCDMGVSNETEISHFNLEDYKAYQLNPTSKW